MSYTKVSRVDAVLGGVQPDYPPFSCWYHFAPEDVRGSAAIDAHLRHVDALDLDFLKVMNDNLYPRMPAESVIQSVEDLRTLRVMTPDAPAFADQLEVLRELAARLGGTMRMTTTMFNGWSTLRYLCAAPTSVHRPPVMDRRADPRDETIARLLRADRSAVAAAVQTISESLAGFARACIEAGSDGVFLSVRDDWVDTDENGASTYDEIVQPGDRAILDAAAKGTFNVLHVCGRPKNFDRFAGYPVHVLNWADRCVDPSIARVRDTLGPVLCGGLDNLVTLAEGTPEDCAKQARDAVVQAGNRPMFLAPGCTYDPDRVPLANLKAARDAVRE